MEIDLRDKDNLSISDSKDDPQSAEVLLYTLQWGGRDKDSYNHSILPCRTLCCGSKV